MPIQNATFGDFSEGEISYKMRSRADIPVYKSTVEWMQNFIAFPQGPMTFRPGTQYVNHTRRHQPAVLIPFFYNDIQAYLVEATQGYFRFYKSTGIILEGGVNITGITNSDPGTVTAPGHGYSNGNEVFIYNTTGMMQLDGRSFIVTNVTTNTFDLYDDFGNPVDTSSLTPYVSGGQTFRIYEIETPYQEADLPFLNYAQSTAVLYIVNRGYAPRKLTIVTETDWTLTTFTRTGDPFTGTNWPGAVAFTSDGRLIYGGTNSSPNTVWGSAGPDSSGNPRYDDLLHSSTPVAIDSYTFTLAVIHGETDSIRWISSTDNFLVVGTFGSVRYLYGSAPDQPVTPLNVNARSVNTYGAAFIQPIPLGPQMLYVQRSGNIIRSIEYDYLINGYQSVDKNLIADHILNTGIKTITNQVGIPDIMWACRNDGELVGLTYNSKENKYGWHRHLIAGGSFVEGTSATVEWVQRLPQENNKDLLFMICSRLDNQGRTVRFVEYITPFVIWPDPLAYYTGDKISDTTKYLNVLYEQQKNGWHLDAASEYDGSDEGFVLGITMTPGSGADVPNTANVTFTASSAFFTSSMVGRQLWKGYDSNGNGGGRATITSYISSTEVECLILDNGYDNINTIPAGQWYITATTVSALNYLEGQTVTIVNDGALYGTQEVINGQVTLNRAASKIIVGLPYSGLIKTVNVDMGTKSGPGGTKLRNVREVRLRLYNTQGLSIGTDPYNMKEIEFRQTGQVTGRPIPLYTGTRREPYPQDSNLNDSPVSNENFEKHIYLLQDTPFPCTINSFDPFMETSES